MNELLILHADAEIYQQTIAAAQLPQLQIHTATTPQQALAYRERANLLMGLPAYLVEFLPNMSAVQWVQSTSAGVNELCQADSRRDYKLTNVRDTFGPAMSEYVFAHVLSLERRLPEMRQAQSNAIWLEGDQASYRPLSTLTMGIIGLGSIGRCIAATADHFGMRVLGVKRDAEPVAAVERVYGLESMGTFLGQLDYLVMVLPDTPATRYFMNAERLSALKSGAVLINVGRGTTLDEKALLASLQQKHLRAAVLDVFEKEPLATNSPLWSQANVTVTPHHSALSFAPEISNIFIDNYPRFLQGEPLKNLIDFERGY